MKTLVMTTVKCETVGKLLDELAAIAKDRTVSSVLDAQIDTPMGGIATGFRIIRQTLSDKSEVLNFELMGEQ
jgi:hypothetical protein